VFKTVSTDLPLFGNIISSIHHFLIGVNIYLSIPTKLLADERLAFSGKIRFEKSAAPGIAAFCNPFTWSDSLIRCSDIWMFTQKAGVHEYNRVAMITTDESDVDNGW